MTLETGASWVGDSNLVNFVGLSSNLAPIPEMFEVPPGMPRSIFNDKYSRLKDPTDPTSFQSWGERLTEVVDGNFSLVYDDMEMARETTAYRQTLALAKKGLIPFSGRHLQHGDLNQGKRTGDLFCNCTASMLSYGVFELLMKGCGVGRDYSADICFVDWNNLPDCRFVLSREHPDYEPWIEAAEDARHKYDTESEAVRWFNVEDSAEGWAKVVMIMETAAFHKRNRDTMFVFDLSKVRKAGEPLKGQQNRPASGPKPFIMALHQVMSIKNAGMKPWKQALYIDHYLAACVVVGGVRRSARIAVKSWFDRDVIEFIDIKRGGHLWSANNSILVDVDFWQQAQSPAPSHARRVFDAAVASSYFDNTGEPGFFNADRINTDERNMDSITVETFLSPKFVQMFGGIHARTKEMIGYHLDKAKKKRFRFIPNPCGEIPLAVYGAYCNIGDLCLAYAGSLEETLVAAARLAEALVRVNTMDFMYQAEVQRTNRIGVSLTGIHEFAWRHFGLSFPDLVKYSVEQIQDYSKLAQDEPYSFDGKHMQVTRFWLFIDKLRQQVEEAANKMSERLGLPHPSTYTCIKPSGTISKVMFCTEGAHLAASLYYIRWIMQAANTKTVQDHIARGYPVKDVSKHYNDTVVIGFPTKQPIVEMMPADLVVTAPEASFEDQFRWLQLLEAFWLGPDRRNAQISYTLKYDPKVVTYDRYVEYILKYQPTVRCVSLMPQIDKSAYEYVPEEVIDAETYYSLMGRIKAPVTAELYDNEALTCEGGACPIEPNLVHTQFAVSTGGGSI